jgi:CubicO group peptidase (beta-lactamase class C family)
LNTTAFDYAKFLQMILNGGSYGDARILGPQTVRQMTRNQIPGIGTEVEGWHPEASWGLGIRVLDHERWPWQDASLTRKGILTHGGGGGTDFWIDPENEIVGVYFAVCEDTTNRNAFENRSDFDLFQNMVCASIRP